MGKLGKCFGSQGKITGFFLNMLYIVVHHSWVYYSIFLNTMSKNTSTVCLNSLVSFLLFHAMQVVCVHACSVKHDVLNGSRLNSLVSVGVGFLYVPVCGLLC